VIARCAYCGRRYFIGSGGFCSRECEGAATWLAAVPEADAVAKAEELRDQSCPECKGHGPIDVHVTHRCWSAIAFTRVSTRARLCCARCARASRIYDTVVTLTLGWWGMPFGLVFTPLQAVRNLTAPLVFPGARPTAALVRLARRGLAEQRSGHPMPEAFREAGGGELLVGASRGLGALLERRALLGGMTAFGLIGFVGLGAWALRLPELRGSYFVLWHQLVRVGAALSGTIFVFGTLALLLPWLLDRSEGRGFVPFVASRHVRSSKSGFLTAISGLSILGVGVSAFALCAVISIMGGFGSDLKRKILGNNAHIRIDSTAVGGFGAWDDAVQKVRLTRGVRAASPVAGGEAMASSASNTAGVILRGVDPQSIGSVVDLLANIEIGKFEYLLDEQKLARLPAEEPICIGSHGEVFVKGPDPSPWLGKVDPSVDPPVDPAVDRALARPDAFPGIIVGRELAKTLHVCVGDEITLVAPIGDLGPMGVMPRSRKFRVAGIFYSGMYEYDASHAYVRLDVGQSFLDLKANVTAIDVKVDEPDEVTPVRDRVAAALGGDAGLRVRDWQEMNRNLFSALKLEKIATFIILSIAILVASFCIVCTLLLMVTEKSKEIAILKAMGASNRAILGVFIAEGTIIGGIGTVFGVVTGLVTCLGLIGFGVRLDPDVYYVDRLPIAVDPVEYGLVTASAIMITVLATVYPAVAASRLRPVDGIRYE
jgi:lipoprotein-releasing system permease protein